MKQTTNNKLHKIPPTPRTLGKHGRTAYKRAADELLSRNSLKRSDADLLEMYAAAIDTCHQAQKVLTDEGLLLKDANGLTRRNPAWTVWRSAAETARQMASRLTITPYDRARVPAKEAAEEKADPLQGLYKLKSKEL